MNRGRRAPTADELRLWAAVARSVAPLGGRAPIEAAPPTPPPAAERPSPASAPAQRRQIARPAATPAPTEIDRRTIGRLARGRLEIDARIDLHGMTQAAAHGRLARFLKQAQAEGARLVLIITGKGKPGPDLAVGGERGVLRRAVPLWLSAAEMRPFVVGFGEASPPHGGGGALYVRIRRPRG